MRGLARALARAYRDIIPSGRHRWALLSLILVGAAIPLTELLITKIFTDAITSDSATTLTEVAPQLMLFAALFLATRVAHYVQRTYRVTYFQAAFSEGGRQPPNLESWRWALGLELVTILTAVTQLIVMATCFVVLAPVFGAINVLLIAVLAEVVGRLFTRQSAEQRQYVERGRARERVATHTRVRSRIVSAEIGGLVSSVGVLILLVVLLAMSLNGLISASSTIVLFLGLRMQNSTFSTLSGGVMRFARAQANSY
jgi:hypothetical protein